jgi:signal transduction histidine kinase/CheY-like chemotaxis protein
MPESDSIERLNSISSVNSELQHLQAKVVQLEQQVESSKKAESEIQRLNHDLEGQILKLAVLNAQLKSLTQRLARARDQAVDASRVKSQFLANMSHEIRTPMNAVIGMSDLLLRSQLSNQQTEFAEIIRDSASNLLDIINDVLDFSKIEAGKMRIELSDFDPCTVVEGTAELLAEKARQKKLQLMTFVSPELPRQMRADPGRLRQVLLNLVSNAVKFTESGSVVIGCTTERVEDNQWFVRFAVSDTGIGISESSLQNIFEPFVQADGSVATKYGGTGLGLSICSRLVELMGGRLAVVSDPKKGSEFSFTVPLENAIAEPVVRPLNLAHRKILLIGLPDVARRIIESYCQSWSVSSVHADSMAQALEMIKQASTNHSAYDFAVVPSFVQSASSNWLATELAKPSGSCSTKLVLYSLEGERFEDAVIDDNFSAYISNPVKRVLLFECLSNLLQQEVKKGHLPSRPRTGDHSQTRLKAIGEFKHLILLAEDNPVNQKVALLQLERMGFSAHAVANGHEALNALSRTNYSLILMDCQMPELDGFQATNAIRKNELLTGNHIPIVAMTAHAMEGDRERCIAEGMDDYISKPVNPQHLQSLLTKWLKLENKPTPTPPPVGDFATSTLSQAHSGASRFGVKPSGYDRHEKSDSIRSQLDTSEMPAVQPDCVDMRTTYPVDLRRLSEDYSGADPRVISRVYFSTCDRILKDVADAIISKDARALRALAFEMQSNANSFHALEMSQLGAELIESVDRKNWTEAKILAEALRLALENLKSFVATWRP